MGAASSIFTQIVLNICWKLRLYLEERDDFRGIQSLMSPSDTGFLNTPEATSTPVSPCSTSGPLSIDSSQAMMALTTMSQRPRRRKHRHQRRLRVNEILSPVQEERLRIAALGKSGTRIGITPSVPKRAPLVARNVICAENFDLNKASTKSQTFMALDLALQPNMRKRVGLRL